MPHKSLSVLSFNILNDFELKRHCHKSNHEEENNQYIREPWTYPKKDMEKYDINYHIDDLTNWKNRLNKQIEFILEKNPYIIGLIELQTEFIPEIVNRLNFRYDYIICPMNSTKEKYEKNGYEGQTFLGIFWNKNLISIIPNTQNHIYFIKNTCCLYAQFNFNNTNFWFGVHHNPPFKIFDKETRKNGTQCFTEFLQTFSSFENTILVGDFNNKPDHFNNKSHLTNICIENGFDDVDNFSSKFYTYFPFANNIMYGLKYDYILYKKSANITGHHKVNIHYMNSLPMKKSDMDNATKMRYLLMQKFGSDHIPVLAKIFFNNIE